MKRSTRAMVRDSARRSQRLQLIQHDVPQLAVSSPADQSSTSAAPALTSSGSSDKARANTALAHTALDAQISAVVETRVETLVREQVQAHLKELREAAERAAQDSGQTRVSADAPMSQLHIPEETPASIAGDERTAPYEIEEESSGHLAASSDVPRSQASAPSKATVRAATDTAVRTAKREKIKTERAASDIKPAGPAVRVVTRNKISGEAARADAPPSLARTATPEREQSGLAARCLAHAGQHYRGATEDDVVEAWKAMRERFHLSPENKIVARRALLKWLQRSKNVCASNVHWYGDFVAVRSCAVRVPSTHPASGADGWFVLFDPNGEGFMREPLFTEAFETPSTRYAGAVPRMSRPAWISEERRAAAAARHGGADLRPFSPETADDLSAQDFSRGRAE